MKPTPAPENTWGGRAAQRRADLKLTQKQAVEIICAQAGANGDSGITQQGLSRFETGGTHPHFSTLEKIARAYGTTVEELFPMDLRPKGPSKAALESRSAKGSRRKSVTK